MEGAFASRQFDGRFKEYQIGCYSCRNGNREVVARRKGNSFVEFFGIGFRVQGDLASPRKAQELCAKIVAYLRAGE
jgi:hypothetical protein